MVRKQGTTRGFGIFVFLLPIVLCLHIFDILLDIVKLPIRKVNP